MRYFYIGPVRDCLQYQQFVNKDIYRVKFMLVNKKIKSIEQKPRPKASQTQTKKVKKQKNSSPNKLKTTPQKRKLKKDQNVHINKPSITPQQNAQYYKSKQSQKHSTIHKKSQNRQTKSKLLTTSPIYIPHSKSKSKSRSKSKSLSRPNTYRSTQDKDFGKSIAKKLFSHTKQNKSKSKEKDKSRSRSRLRTDRDASPLKEIRQVKRFDVADRQIRYNKTQVNEYKKAMKKKIQGYRSKGQAFLYPTEPIHQQQPIEQPKVKLKKRVPQIKTQFSERRGSFFDENLLKKLEINHQQGKKAQVCPFIHIKSNFQQRLKDQFSFHSRPQQAQQTSSQTNQVQMFKREQQLKWNLMLVELKNLKNEPIVSEKIDVLIANLNKNYTSLRERADQLSSRGLNSASSNRSNDQLQPISNRDSLLRGQIQGQSQKINEVLLNQLSFHEHNAFLKQKINISSQNIKSNESSLKFLSPIPCEIKSKIVQESKLNQNIQDNISIQRPQQQQQHGQIAFKRSNNINLSQFYNFIQKRQNERRVEFEPFMKFTTEDIQNYSLQLIKNEAQHRMSDKNILNELNILESSSNFIQNNEETQFMREMEGIRKSKQEVIASDVAFSGNFHNEIHMNEEMSSQSMLLNMSQNNHKKNERVVDEIQQALILQFCVQILRSKSILHNFITTYSQLVQNNAINVEMELPNDPRSITQASDKFVQEQIQRLLNHIQINYKQNFMSQIKIPFQCKPIQILRYIRTADDEFLDASSMSSKSDEPMLQVPYFNQQMIEEFEIDVIRNQYFIPGYFSFNHCIYDEFNDIIDELRPYGNKGKAVFSLELSHPMTDIQLIKQEITKRVNKHLTQHYEFQNLADEKYPNEQGIFELIYFTSVDVVEMIFEQEVFQIAKTFSRSNLKWSAF